VGAITSDPELRPTTERAIELFISDKRTQGVDAEVLGKYKRELARLKDFMKKRSKFFPHEIGVGDLTEFRAGWTIIYPSSVTRSKVQERLRGFLRYCLASNLIVRVPQLSAIQVKTTPTLPLSPDEYHRLLTATTSEFSDKKAKRVHAFIQLMRHSGLAIRDTTTLERIEIKHDTKKGIHRVVTSRQKTGTHVSVPIPPDVAKEVLEVMELNDSKKYIFWNSGTGTVRTAVTNWQTDIKQTFVAAGMPKGHSHQLRDTFAVSLLEKGVPLEEVSKALGHTSLKTTEKHYAPWVVSRQDRLDEQVVGTWNV
jgi:site-specific recombinase XerD